MSFMSDIQTQAAVRQRGIMSQVYLWMAAGLLLTGAIASFTASSPALLGLIFGTPFVLIGLLIVEVVMVIALSAAIARLSPATATALFLAYSALNGLTLASVFIVYTQESIAGTFVATAGSFAALSAVGYFTKRDLSAMGRFLIIALVGFLIGTIINLFVASSGLYWLLTYLGVLVFAGLTAYDTQRIKRMAEQATDETSARRVAILGALKLYLDFVNMFLLLLRIFGGRRG